MSNFRIELEKALLADDGQIDDKDKQKILRVLNMREGRRKQNILRRMERKAAFQLEQDGYIANADQVDWSAVDWSRVITIVVRVVLLIIIIF